jgi:aminoglycoside 3-N-acetyltransferase
LAWTKERIAADFVELGVRPGDSLLVHASMRAVGPVEGGADTVINALLDVLGPEGTILVPAFNEANKLPANLMDPLARSLADSSDFIEGPSRSQVGIFATRLFDREEVSRSLHPTLSFAAIGPNAAFLTESTPFHYPLGSNSPLARLHQINGNILVVGVNHAANSAVHLAENWVDAPYARRKALVRTIDGAMEEMEGSPECSNGFSKIEPVLRQARILRSGYIGNAASQRMSIQHVVSMAMEMMRGNPESFLCDNPLCAACTLARKFTTAQDQGSALSSEPGRR